MMATYRSPAAAMRRHLDNGVREDRVIAVALGACALLFVAQWPGLARQAHTEGTELPMLLGGALLGVVFLLPLALYALAGVTRLIGWAVGGKGSGFGARMALFWALFAATPVALLHGMVVGLVGPGPAQILVGALWLGLFLWFWLRALIVSESGYGSE